MSGLRKVDAPFTTVDNTVAEDRTLSFRARGVLVYLLAKPDGWAVRAEAIARDGKEGRDAILAVLRELGARGHYRIVRYRDGGPGAPWKTETEVSHRPMPEWATEWAANEGKPVVLKEKPQVTPGTGFSGLGDGGVSPQVTPENGFPDAGRPASGEAASGQSAALVKTLTNETDGTTTTAAAVAPTGRLSATVIASTGTPGTEVDLFGVVDGVVDDEDDAGEPDPDEAHRRTVRTLVAAYVDVVTARGGHCTGSLLDSIGKNVKRVVRNDKIPEPVLLVAVQKAASKGLRSIDGVLAATDSPQVSWDRSPAAKRAMQNSWIEMGRKLDAARAAKEGVA